MYMNTLHNSITNADDTKYYDPFMKDDCRPVLLIQSQWRIVIKSILYRLVAFLVTAGVTYSFTNNISQSINMGIIIEFLNTVIYYVYEQLWNIITWGYISNSLLES